MTSFKKISLFAVLYLIIQMIRAALSFSAQQFQLRSQCGYYTEELSRTGIAEMDEALIHSVEITKRDTKLKPPATSKAKESDFGGYLFIADIRTGPKEEASTAGFSVIESIESFKKENGILFAIFLKMHEFTITKKDSYLTDFEINPRISTNSKIEDISQKYISNYFLQRIDLNPEIYRKV